ncbi:MAG: histidine kinase dimerization/phospho-acceptor domain-containing protein [bacterium]
MNPISAPEDVGALWLHTLQRAIGRASHDVKDALNGVSVNLEVIRSRSAKPDVPASAIAQFGDAAAQQMERLTNLIEAVLALSRLERTPTDVGLTLRRITTLCSASSSSADAAVRMFDDGAAGSTFTRVPGDVVRLVLLAPLLDVVAGSDRANRASEVACTLSGDDDAVHVKIAAADRRVPASENIADVARAAGVRWTEGKQDLSLAFPRA